MQIPSGTYLHTLASSSLNVSTPAPALHNSICESDLTKPLPPHSNSHHQLPCIVSFPLMDCLIPLFHCILPTIALAADHTTISGTSSSPHVSMAPHILSCTATHCDLSSSEYHALLSQPKRCWAQNLWISQAILSMPNQSLIQSHACASHGKGYQHWQSHWQNPGVG